MQEYQLRVVEEKKELDAKQDKLIAFIDSENFMDVDVRGQGLLFRQLLNMKEYSAVLVERISMFT